MYDSGAEVVSAEGISYRQAEREIHDLSTQQQDPESILVNSESLLIVDSCDGG